MPPTDLDIATPPTPSLPPAASLTTEMLHILYRETSTRRPWKDALSDWILNQHAAGHTLSPIALLKYLQTTQPEVFMRLVHDPRITHEVLAFFLPTITS